MAKVETTGRADRFLRLAGLCLAGWAAAGCAGPLLRTAAETADQRESVQPDVRLVGFVAHPHGMTYAKVENVSLVTGLNGTGENPAPSTQRAALLSEMHRRGIENPNAVLQSPHTAMVVVTGILRPGIRAGEKFDVEISVPARSEATSLRGAWLMETRLSETAVLGDQLRKGRVLATAQGPVLIDPSATSKNDPALATRGRILGGGVSTADRELGLILDHEHRSIRLSQQVAKAVNLRFNTFIRGRKEGVATPKTDEFVSLMLHPRYRENVSRYMRVVRSIAVQESALRRQSRLITLREQLLDPVTSSAAALRLEAIGDQEGVDVLEEGALSDNAEVRFYASEALAYLDRTSAVVPLARAAIDEPAYRINALAALSAMKDGAAHEALTDMLSLKSAETRYGAFRALWTMDPSDPLVRGEELGGKFRYHILKDLSDPLIHATSSHRPEIVLFGADHRIQLPVVLDAGDCLLVNGLEGEEITVSSFAPGEPTQQRVVPPRVDDVIRAVVELGGDYPDVVQMLQQANDAKALSSRFRVNALPEAGRVREDAEEETESVAAKGGASSL